jgi:hypothetical protein
MRIELPGQLEAHHRVNLSLRSNESLPLKIFTVHDQRSTSVSISRTGFPFWLQTFGLDFLQTV